MRKLFLLAAINFYNVCNAQKNIIPAPVWDQRLKISSCKIDICADAFTATTFIEMEFYNPSDKEKENLYSFNLRPGQVITAFQLDLNGNYRNGSIEEKWKARNAYNSIVGKRIDPALLQMDGYDHYSLRVYPVPAHGSRKITMTIQQILKADTGSIRYELPLAIKDTVSHFSVNINLNYKGQAPLMRGLFKKQFFTATSSGYQCNGYADNIVADQWLSFDFPLNNQELIFTSNDQGGTEFAIRFQPTGPALYELKPENITVFWDVSLTGKGRDTEKEIAFLETYIREKKIKQLTIIPFNHQLKDTAIFCTESDFHSQWQLYLRQLKYIGATCLGVIDLSRLKSDLAFVFSDGHDNYGHSGITYGRIPLFAVHASVGADKAFLQQIVLPTGGRYIDLISQSKTEALLTASFAKIILLAVYAPGRKYQIDQQLPLVFSNHMFVSGDGYQPSDTIIFEYGNSQQRSALVKFVPGRYSVCSSSQTDRIAMLLNAEKIIHAESWQKVLEFGRQEKIVTPYTSYIVLERLEDYMKYMITPPKELEAQCDMQLFAKAKAQRWEAYKDRTLEDILIDVANAYNEELKRNDKNADIIQTEKLKNEIAIVVTELKAEEKKQESRVISSIANKEPITPTSTQLSDVVVVTAMGTIRQQRELGYSAVRISGNELTQGRVVNLQNGLTGKVSGLNVQTTNNGVFADTRITIRGIRSLTGNNQPLLVIDGITIPLEQLNMINPNDIASVTVLKSSAAAAIYGGDAVNGAIVLQTKKGRNTNWGYHRGPYRLKDCDEEDYMSIIRQSDRSAIIQNYEDMRKEYGADGNYYLDVAQLLFEKKMTKEAHDVLFSLLEVVNDRRRGMKVIAYTLEEWNCYDEAIEVYKSVISIDSTDISVWRNLAWAFYQQERYQEAVNTLYAAICRNFEEMEASDISYKSIMLKEMNAIISSHKKAIDVSAIMPQLIKPVSFDMKISIEDVRPYGHNSVYIKEPTGTENCSWCYPRGLGTFNQAFNNGFRSRLDEYQIRSAVKGKYRIRLDYYDYSSSDVSMIRLMTLKNAGREDMKLITENVIMNNQSGKIEISELIW